MPEPVNPSRQGGVEIVNLEGLGTWSFMPDSKARSRIHHGISRHGNDGQDASPARPNHTGGGIAIHHRYLAVHQHGVRGCALRQATAARPFQVPR